MELKNKAPFNVNTMLLLIDGSVMCQDGGGSGPSARDTGMPHWWKLTPDKFGNYHDGTWLPLATGPNSPLFYASARLRDGRVFVAGGEYNAGAQVDLLASEIYHPFTDAWTSIGAPTGWTNIGDASGAPPEHQRQSHRHLPPRIPGLLALSRTIRASVRKRGPCCPTKASSPPIASAFRSPRNMSSRPING